jgi:hypothetical protein
MDGKWERRRILIWGKTRPELSTKYRETVCTGGVFADNKKLVRLYPIPLRYMDDEKIFKKYQWIEAYVTKSGNDPRPESYKIRYDDIEISDIIAPGAHDWGARAEWVITESNVFRSVEALKERQQTDLTSLGLVKPREIIGISSSETPSEEVRDFWKRYTDSLQQMQLPLELDVEHKVKPLKPANFKFKIRFRCEDERCQSVHEFGILDWEIDALYFNCIHKGDSPQQARDKVIKKLNDVCSDDKDLYFYLGNIFTHPQNFTIVGLWYPRKPKQMGLFQP